MVLKTDDHATLIDFATKVLQSRLDEIAITIQGTKNNGTTPANAWNQINEIMERK